MLTLRAGDHLLEIDPLRGGSISRFQWRGFDLFRPSSPGSMLDCACFPLVPYSNRITKGQFVFEGRSVCIPPNLPEVSERHPLHGTGWLANWSLLFNNATHAVLEHFHHGNEHWPWTFCARQLLVLTEKGLSMALSIRNEGDSAMPAGLGFHPYFPLDPDTVYLGLHRGEWQTNGDCLPERLIEHPAPVDWWKGAPVGSRAVDTAYSDRKGPLSIAWPSRGIQMVLQPSDLLGQTVVYVPQDGDYFCVEPVSHMTDALNRLEENAGMRRLEPGETVEARVAIFTNAIAP